MTQTVCQVSLPMLLSEHLLYLLNHCNLDDVLPRLKANHPEAEDPELGDEGGDDHRETF